MNKQSIIILVLAAIVIAALLIFRRKDAAGNTIYTNNFLKSPPGKDGVPGTSSGFEIDLSKIPWLSNGSGGQDVEKQIITYTNE